MKKSSKLLQAIRNRIVRNLTSDFTPDDKFTDPNIEPTAMDAEAMRIFLMQNKLVPKYQRWLFTQGKEYILEESEYLNNLFSEIQINDEHIDKINQFFRKLLPYNFPEMYKLLTTRISESNLVVEIPFSEAAIVDMFYKFHQHNFIHFPNRRIMAEWISKHIRYGQRIENTKKYKFIKISKSQAYKVIQENKRKPKREIIDIVDNEIHWSHETDIKEF